MLLLLVALDYGKGASVPSSGTCHDSYDCGSGMCCRDSFGTVVSTQYFTFPPPFPTGSTSGMCTLTTAKAGELCDTNCDCEAGFTCYRPVSGVCCQPKTCYNSTWVQHHDWANCRGDPRNCALPP